MQHWYLMSRLSEPLPVCSPLGTVTGWMPVSSSRVTLLGKRRIWEYCPGGSVMEPMGAETYLYLDTGSGSSCIARVDAHTKAEVGDEVSLAVTMSKAHLFDAKSEKAII